jgi:hypothetical protein
MLAGSYEEEQEVTRVICVYVDIIARNFTDNNFSYVAGPVNEYSFCVTFGAVAVF